MIVVYAIFTVTYIVLLVGSLIAQFAGHWASTVLDLAAAAVMVGPLVFSLVCGEWLAAGITVAAGLVALSMFRYDRQDKHGTSRSLTFRGPLRRFRDRRAARRDYEEAVVIAALRRAPNLSGVPISERTGIKAGRVHVVLARLEGDGRVVSDWDDTRYPRRRQYRLADVPREASDV